MRLLCLVLSIVLLTGPPGELRAENPTREKCTCNLNPDDPPADGAWVKNAAACWSTEIKDLNWCDIVVESLQGPQAAQPTSTELLGSATNPSALIDVLQGRFDNFLQVSAVEGSLVDLNRAANIVIGRLKENAALIANCVTALSEQKRGFVQDGDGGVVCRISDVSGWLRLEIPVEGARIVYMVAPAI
ncbi:hypothetical protein [Rhizobium sp. Root1204]|uniref:hypothetical protein n=1 Tax=Rhizobium sp. Root1204 TaxID=1736428 RepID=UPI0007160337|nr:hypothetical protein [Rhizobium sp. Root1204]KQV29397.1 hypothetical protein ASC96_12100 [Rhizobium sp. Root1204]